MGIALPLELFMDSHDMSHTLKSLIIQSPTNTVVILPNNVVKGALDDQDGT